MRISGWSSDVCSSDLGAARPARTLRPLRRRQRAAALRAAGGAGRQGLGGRRQPCALLSRRQRGGRCRGGQYQGDRLPRAGEPARPGAAADGGAAAPRDRKSVVEGKRVGGRVDCGGGGINKKKKSN